jgi:hypothetical protein
LWWWCGCVGVSSGGCDCGDSDGNRGVAGMVVRVILKIVLVVVVVVVAE